MYKTKKTGALSSPTKGVLYFNHFPSNYLKPYGQAAKKPDHETIMKRLHGMSCEWLKRPKVAMSELAATLNENMQLLQDNSGQLINDMAVENLKTAMQPMHNSLLKLNTRNNTPANKGDIKNVLMTLMNNNNGLPGIMEQMFEVGGAMYTMAIQYFVAKHLFENPNEYANKCIGTDEAIVAFKSNASIQGLVNFLNSTCATLETGHSNKPVAKRNLLTLLEECYEEEDEGPSTSQKCFKRRQVVETSASSSSSATSSSEDEKVQVTTHTTQKKAATKRKRQAPHLLSSQATRKSSQQGMSSPQPSHDVAIKQLLSTYEESAAVIKPKGAKKTKKCKK